ncbi:MAG: hypothetical protein A3K90_04490 [Pelodictyon luteolum]|uniref:Uncharacterized protein n=1 Tax=Pelodictyon luteolum TaxID=1100 RepID=A0A165MCE1_PELLU|nr:MAG: hypothetical protein A3K90_04490 [Pelodictyon luteolum]
MVPFGYLQLAPVLFAGGEAFNEHHFAEFLERHIKIEFLAEMFAEVILRRALLDFMDVVFPCRLDGMKP